MPTFRALTREEAAEYAPPCGVCGSQTLKVYSKDGPEYAGRFCPRCGKQESKQVEILTVESAPEPNGKAHESDEWLSGQLAAEHLGCHINALSLYTRHGRLHPREVGGLKTYSRNELDVLRAERCDARIARHSADPDLIPRRMAARLLGAEPNHLAWMIRQGKLRAYDEQGQEQRVAAGFLKRSEVEAYKVSQQGSTAVIPATAADPLGLLLAEYREAAARLAVDRRELAELVERANALGERIKGGEASVRGLREQLDAALDEVAG